MSYLRWDVGCRWYVFWSASGSGDTIDSQVLEVCSEGRVSYKELKNDPMLFFTEMANLSWKPNKSELLILRDACDEWLRDVEERFQT